MVLAFVLGTFQSAFGLTYSHGPLSVAGASIESLTSQLVDAVHVHADGTSHDVDIHIDEAETASQHVHHGFDHTHENVQVPPALLTEWPALPSLWEAPVATQSPPILIFRLDRPPKQT